MAVLSIFNQTIRPNHAEIIIVRRRDAVIRSDNPSGKSSKNWSQCTAGVTVNGAIAGVD